MSLLVNNVHISTILPMAATVFFTDSVSKFTWVYESTTVVAAVAVMAAGVELQVEAAAGALRAACTASTCLGFNSSSLAQFKQRKSSSLTSHF